MGVVARGERGRSDGLSNDALPWGKAALTLHTHAIFGLFADPIAMVRCAAVGTLGQLNQAELALLPVATPGTRWLAG